MPSWANATTFSRLSDTVLSLYKIFACSITAKYCAEKDIFFFILLALTAVRVPVCMI